MATLTEKSKISCDTILDLFFLNSVLFFLYEYKTLFELHRDAMSCSAVVCELGQSISLGASAQ